MPTPAIFPNAFLSIRAKLISVFVAIKIIPMLLLALLAWWAAERLAGDVADRSNGMAGEMLATVKTVERAITEDAEQALDDRSREAIESITTDTARAVASFLYDRDKDIRQAARQEPTEESYGAFLADRTRELFAHGTWVLAADGKRWVPSAAPDSAADTAAPVAATENTRRLHVRPPEYLGERRLRPLYAEMTFIGLDGHERVKVRPQDQGPAALADIRDHANTFARAERYWPELQRLKSGEIYVSEVIGAYVGSRVIGPFLPRTAARAGIAFEPENSAYAGVENPVGRRFRGIVRWGMPVERGGKRIGYVTLALDHDHIRQFTDRIVPTPERYTPIADAGSGNYAFMWDHKHRAISHPRDYFIVGYDPETGRPQTPWLDQTLYDSWQASGKPSDEFLAGVAPFVSQSLDKKPAEALARQGMVALDCRYLNFAPQCEGWSRLTENGGSGSFLIFWNGIWKLTTAAAIPYHTGQYGKDRRGFGYVTIGANVDDFHSAATASSQRIQSVIARKAEELAEQRADLIDTIHGQLSRTANELVFSTLGMVVLVVLIAIGMATYLTGRITAVVNGIKRFKAGELGHRLEIKSNDEIGALAVSFNHMADSLENSFLRLTEELAERQRTNELLNIAAIAFEAQEGMLITDADQVILQVNKAFCDMSGYQSSEIVGRKIEMFEADFHDTAFFQNVRAAIASAGSWQGEVWGQRKNGDTYPKWVCITAVRNADRVISHYVCTNTDITNIKSAEDEIRKLAFYDPLTGLPNRRLLMDRLQKALESSERTRRCGALLFIDLDNFKYLNDTLGHDKGDLLLQQVASRLESCVRKSDTVARLGGDEFVAMLEGLNANAAQAAIEAEAVGRQILAALTQPYDLDGNDHPSTPSIGVTLFAGQTARIDDLLKQADLAMYQAKAAGRNALRFFDHGMQAKVSARTALEADFRNAIRDEQFVLYYQAQVDDGDRLTGAEVLLRWQHPERGLISPVEFIPLAEETGLIVPLGYWTLEKVCAQLAAWADNPATAHLTLAVNVSARQFQLPDFHEHVLGIIAASGANPRNLKLELTESMLVSNVDDIIAKMVALRRQGVGFSLDDFGTGFSSLSYLKRLPLDQMKIDRSFVQDLLVDPNDAVIVNTIIALAHSLGVSAIAEGVETQAQRAYLASYGCTAFQGYLFGRPVPIEELAVGADSREPMRAPAPAS